MAMEAWRCVVGGAVDGWGGVEVDVAGEAWRQTQSAAGAADLVRRSARRRRCRHGGTRLRSGSTGGGEKIVARVIVRAPHT
jgi:hypothetical protein